MKNRFENNFYPGELLVRRNLDNSCSPVLVIGIVERFCVPEKALHFFNDEDVYLTYLTYLMYDGHGPPYEVIRLDGEQQPEGTVYERLASV